MILVKLASKKLIIRPDRMNLIEKKVGNRFELNSTEKDFLNRTLIVWSLRITINKWGLMMLKEKYTTIQVQRQPTECAKVYLVED